MVVKPINYVPGIEMFINVLLLLQYIRVKCLSIRCSRSKYTSCYFPSCSILTRRLKKFISITMVMNTPPSHLYIAPMRACVQLSQNAQAIANQKFTLMSNFHVKRRWVVFFLLLAVKVLSDIGYLVLAFRRVEFFLQVFMTDFHSFRKGK